MKKLLVFTMFLASPALAGKMNQLVFMTMESIEQTLSLEQSEHSYQVLSRDFVKAAAYRDLAIKTELVTTNEEKHIQAWTCVTQFVKTSSFFEVSETDCQ